MIRQLIHYLFIALLLLQPIGLWAADPIASLTSAIGDVHFKRIKTDNWKRVNQGMFFFEGDKIRTQDDGKAELYFSNGTLVHVGNDSELAFRPQKNTKKRRLFLINGRTWNKVVKGTQFEVESVHGVAAVKGTEFDVVLPDGMDFMNVFIREGVVEIFNELGSVDGTAGTKVTIKETAPPEAKAVKKKDYPTDTKGVNTNHRLVVSSSGKKEAHTPFRVQLSLKERGTLSPDAATVKQDITIRLEVAKGDLRLGLSEDSVRSGGESTLEVPLSDGIGQVFMSGPTGLHSLHLAGSTIESFTHPIRIKSLKKNVNVEYVGHDGKTRKVQLLFEKRD